MEMERALPEKRNPLVEPKHTPQLEILVERRRLGQTELTVKAGQIGTSNATKPSNLGMFDYAHLRVPLPKDLQGSGIFAPSRRNQAYPEAYFLMRRSNDGFISATGMFKAAFPWASLEEEELEKKYIKAHPETDSEEIAGNVWIPADSALELADTYGMRPWIEALLDPEPIAKGTHDPNKKIATPPPFKARHSLSAEATSFPPPSERRRTLRSASPAKAPPTPSRKIATPRRSRRAKPTPQTTLTPTAESAAEESTSVEPETKNDSLMDPSKSQATVVDEDGEAEVSDAATIPSDTVKVDIETVTEPAVNGAEPATTTHVTVETPANYPDLPFPQDPQEFLDVAKAEIRSTRKAIVGRAAGKKRRATEAFVDDVDDVMASPSVRDTRAPIIPVEIPERPAKRQRTGELELRKEKIKKRATLGIAASLAVGAMLPVFMGQIFQLI